MRFANRPLVAVTCVAMLSAAGSAIAAAASTPAESAPSAGTHVEIDTPADPETVIFDVADGEILVLADGRLFRRIGDISQHGALRPEQRRHLPAAPPAPPAPAGYEVAAVTPDGIFELLHMATEAGLFVDDPDYGGPGITDQGWLDVVVTTADGTFEHHVYAPNEEAPDPGAQRRREQLFGFIDVLWNVETHLGDDIGEFENYVPDRWLVTFGGYFTSSSGPWPFAATPTEGCAVLPSEPDVDTASGAYTAEIDGERVTVAVQPVIITAVCDA